MRICEGEPIGVTLEDDRYFMGTVAEVVDDGDWLDIRFVLSSVPTWVLGRLEPVAGREGWLISVPWVAITPGHYA